MSETLKAAESHLPPPPDPKKLVTVEQLSEMTGLTVASIRYYLYRSGKLKADYKASPDPGKTGNTIYFKRSTAEAFTKLIKAKQDKLTIQKVANHLAIEHPHRDAAGWHSWLRIRMYHSKVLGKPRNHPQYWTKLNRLVAEELAQQPVTIVLPADA